MIVAVVQCEALLPIGSQY